MKRTTALFAFCFLLASGTCVYADIARPSPSPAPGKVVLHTSLTVIPDKNAYEAHLKISQITLNDLRNAMANNSAGTTSMQRIVNSPTRTIIAGLCLFLSLSFGGVWLMRSPQPRGQKLAAALLLGVAVIGAAAIITQANAGPPPAFEWRNLSQNLNSNKTTAAGIEIEIVPDGYGMTLVVPVKN